MAIKDPIEIIRNSIRRYIRVVAKVCDKLTGGIIRPNHVTIVSLLMHVPMMWAIITDRFVLAVVLLVVFGLFDTLDGELARYQGTSSDQGAILDASADRVKEAMIYTSFVYLFSNQSHVWGATLSIIALSGSMMVSYVKAKGETALVALDKRVSSRDANKILANGLARFEVRIFLIIMALLSRQLVPIIALLAVLSWATVVYRFTLISKKLR